jgi:hypothetical protein
MTMSDRPQWIWRSDQEGLPDSDHSRCIAATGERSLVCGPHLFKLTTRPSIGPTTRDADGTIVKLSTLRLTYAGVGWEHGRATGFWSSEAFDSALRGRPAQHAAGVALLATVAAEISAS